MKNPIAQRQTAQNLAVLLVMLQAVSSQVFAAPTRQIHDANLTHKIDTLLNVPALRMGWQGIKIKSLADGSTWYAHNADHVFLPASNNKLLTSCAALATLTTAFTYQTRILRTGTIDPDGTVHGNLILRGSGDPILTPEDLHAMAHEVYGKGLRRLDGHILYDDSLFDHQRLGDSWTWDDEPYYYSAQISALNVNENLVTVHCVPGSSPGDPVTVTILPTSHYTQIVNNAVTGPPNSTPQISVERLRGQNVLVITGSLPQNLAIAQCPTTDITIDDPSHFAAVLFKDYLQSEGLELTSDPQATGSAAPDTAIVVSEHISPALPEILQRLNKPSDNLIAECLLKTVGAKARGVGTGGEDGTGCQTARAWFKSIGLDLTELNQTDGSGLSRTNYVSPNNIVSLLSYIYKQPYFHVLYDSLPIAGVDGSLKHRMKGTPAEANCHAKTGYVSHASSLSGYVKTHDGELLVFSMLFNNHLARNSVCTAVQDKIVTLLASYTRTRGK